MINRVVLVGRLTKDPELRYTPNGIASCRFTVAINRTFANQNGERDADFINCQAWRKAAENLANYQRKGALIGLEGRIQTHSYEDQNGQRVYTTTVVADSIQFLESRNQASGQQQPQYGNNQPTYTGGQPQQQFGGQGAYQQNQPPMYQSSYTRLDEDPFANSRGPIEVSDDDLPF
ncbi:single-stranded DNA-binding protein [Lysinibacillus sp. BNK-21]|uniref:single-stranded DNA-binding protein n=1 Tax=Lysinibacillus sp. BNK-21 TaxID=3376156 RepID=UPI003B42BC38